MLRQLKLLYVLIFLQLLALQANAILGGIKTQQQDLKEKIIQFDVRKGQTSIVCTGSFINNKKILTAAHCLEHIKQSCLNCDQKIFINNEKYNFTYYLHPNYIKLSNNQNYASTNNFDIAVIEIPSYAKNENFKLNFNFKDEKQVLTYFGYGMSKLKKVDINNSISYHESKRGFLKKGHVNQRLVKNGLLKKEINNVKVNKQNYLDIDKKSQVLRSDSGGPLIHNNQIIGIVRNYEIIDKIVQFISGRELSSKNIQIKMRSTFTLINNKKTEQFLNVHL